MLGSSHSQSICLLLLFYPVITFLKLVGLTLCVRLLFLCEFGWNLNSLGRQTATATETDSLSAQASFPWDTMLERKQLRWECSAQSLKEGKWEVLYIGSAISAFKSGRLQSASLMAVYIRCNCFQQVLSLNSHYSLIYGWLNW